MSYIIQNLLKVLKTAAAHEGTFRSRRRAIMLIEVWFAQINPGGQAEALSRPLS